MKNKAFSLIELLIVLAIMGIVIALAYPSYRQYTLKTHRSEAIQILKSMQLSEEQYRSNNALYGTLAQVWGGATATPSGRYALAVTNVSATTYSVTATAQGAQTADAENGVSCTPMTIAINSAVETKTPAACW